MSRVELRVPAHGTTLSVFESGVGTPLLFLHGGLADHQAALLHVGALSERLRLITPDLRGAGRSHFAGELTWDLLADDVITVLDHLGLERAAVGGVSMGSAVALRAALRHPDRFVAFADYSGLDRPTHPNGARWLLGSAAAVAAHTPAELLDASPPPDAWFEVGSSDDGADAAVARLAARAKAAGLRTRLVVLPNAHHTWRVWRDSFEDSLPFLVRSFTKRTTT